LDEPLTELAARFRRDARLPDHEPVRLTAAARAGRSRPEAIAACGVNSYTDLGGVIYRMTGETGAELLFSATKYDCYAGLHPGITVTVKCYPARWPAEGRTVAVIRQRTRGDHDCPGTGHFPGIGQAITWQLWWQHAPMLAGDARGSCIGHIAEISREEAGQIAAGPAARHRPPGAAGLPAVVSACPEF
jgi:hypothetical protein